MIYNSYLDEESAINSLSLEIEIDNKIKALKKESNRWESFSYITYENKWCLREKGIILDLIITDTQTK